MSIKYNKTSQGDLMIIKPYAILKVIRLKCKNANEIEANVILL